MPARRYAVSPQGGGTPAQTAAPTFNPQAGSYSGTQLVSIACATPNAVIYYTIGATQPTTSSPVYSGPITVPSTETLNAIALASGYSLSQVSSATYTITSQQAATPTFSPGGGTYSSTQSVAIACATPGASIYYTTNGATPTTSSSLYSTPLSVAISQTLQAMATATGYSQSATALASYVISTGAQYSFNPGDYVGSSGVYNTSPANALADITAAVAAGTTGFQGYVAGFRWYHFETSTVSTAPTYNFADFWSVFNLIQAFWPGARYGAYCTGNTYPGTTGLTQAQLTSANLGQSSASYFIPGYILNCGGSVQIPNAYGSSQTTTYAVAANYSGASTYGLNFQALTVNGSSQQVFGGISPQWYNAGVMQAFINLHQAWCASTCPAPTAWASGTAYSPGLQVTYNGNIYTYTNSSNSSGNLPTNATYWTASSAPYAGMTANQIPLIEFFANNDETSYAFISSQNYSSGVTVNPPISVAGATPSNTNFWIQRCRFYSAVCAALTETLFLACDTYSYTVGNGYGSDTAANVAANFNSQMPQSARSAPYALDTIQGLALSGPDSYGYDFSATTNFANNAKQGYYGIASPGAEGAALPAPTYLNRIGVMPYVKQIQPYDYRSGFTGSSYTSAGVIAIMAAQTPHASHRIWCMTDNNTVNAWGGNNAYGANGIAGCIRANQLTYPVAQALPTSLASGQAVGLNLDGISYYAASLPYLNIVLSAGNESVGGPGVGTLANAYNLATLNSSGTETHEEYLLSLDANGYPLAIPQSGLASTQVQFHANFSVTTPPASGPCPAPAYPYAQASTSYTVQFSGAGTIKVSGDASATITASGQTFTVNTPGGGLTFNITASTSGNHITNLVVCETALLGAYNAGQIYHPNYLAKLCQGPVSCIRYMGALNGYNQIIAVNFSSAPASGATSTTVANFFGNQSVWTGSTGSYSLTFSDGEVRSVTLTANANTCTWSGGLTNTVGTQGYIPLANFAGRSTTSSMMLGNQNYLGIPYEHCAALSNATNSDCWITVPLYYSTADVTSLVNLVLPLLNGSSRLILELSNEVWNGTYVECEAAQASGYAIASGLGSGFEYNRAYFGYATSLMANAAIAAAGGNSGRVIPILGGWSANTYASSDALGYAKTYGGGIANIKGIAIAPYFPGDLGSSISAADANTIKSQSDGGLSYLFQCMTGNTVTGGSSPGTLSSIPSNGFLGAGCYTPIANHVALMASYPGMTLWGYEGGQQFSAALPSASPLGSLIYTANRDARMGAAYSAYLQYWGANVGTGRNNSVQLLNAIEGSGSNYAWGLLESTQQQSVPLTVAPYKWQAFQNAIVAPTGATFNYYISTTGNDSNPGTLAQPWAFTSFQNTSANNALMAGKRVGLIAGTYSTSGLSSSNPNDFTASLINVPGGTAASATYVGSSNAAGVYAPRVAIISVGPPVSTQNAIMGGPNGQTAGASSYITIDGLTINGNNLAYNTGGTNSVHLLQFYGVYNGTSASVASETGITIQNCEMYGIETTTHPGGNASLIFLEGCYNCVIQNNYLHDATSTFAADLGHVHALEEYGCYGNQYWYNTIANCSSGIDAKNADTGTIVAYNYFYAVGTTTSAGYSGVPFEGFDGYAGGVTSTGPAPINFLLHHNVLEACVGALIGDETYLLRVPTNIYNNTVYDNSTGANFGWHCPTYAASILSFYNNIYYSTQDVANGATNGKLITGAASGNVLLDYNQYYQGAGNYTDYWSNFTTGYSSLSSWQSAMSQDTHSAVGNPTFSSSYTAGNGPNQFKLGTGSPCIGAGQGGVNMGAWDGTVTQIGANWVSYPLPLG